MKMPYVKSKFKKQSARALRKKTRKDRKRRDEMLSQHWPSESEMKPAKRGGG